MIWVKSSVFQRFIIKLLHDVDSSLIKSLAHVLDNVETIENNFSIGK
ncbi:Uncharacterised protein [Streptococcus pneumoniae]|nr:Uncharacterised protein [Streptococcus pneumoniae]CEW15454.1 Uncharacterised protein [Streptococcus pneumoniae]CEW71269.1 Uncharacterised protein [Streptococcus pneumoniae]CEX04897.1 Uncharacterised protein [Streptococcus pneumoniae]CGF84553.1 Uncharacterised protein [Streptococcus pneumoniae]